MNIAQISDLHLTEWGVKAQLKIDTLPRVEQVLAHIAGQQDFIDVVLVTGDLADDRHRDSYTTLQSCLADFPLPYYLIPGNHDDRELLAGAFPEFQQILKDTGGFCQYAIDNYPVRLIGLDTTIPGRDSGALCQTRLEWLDKTLAQKPQKPTLIFMHHPPFKTGIIEMDAYAMAGSQAFARIIEKHPQVKRIVCGHVHRSIQTSIAGVITSVAPGIAFTQAENFSQNHPGGFLIDTPKYEIHCFNGEQFISHTLSLEVADGPHPYPFP